VRAQSDLFRSGPGDGETKWLTKHEAAPLNRSAGHAGNDPVCTPIETGLENAGHFVRLPTVNLNQKGLRHVPANINARPARAATILELALVERRRQKRQRRTGMALKVELKPHERIIIGSCVITNTEQRTRLLIDGDNIPILREKDILTPETANTPAKLIYLAVQLMYIAPDPQPNHRTYFNLLREIVTVMPSAWPIIEEINNHILSGDLYLALKEARKLIAYEAKLLDEAAAAHPEMRQSA
jgi:flagellar biosynthesis repressor protein FlbT